jgi:hypothetical protein
VPLTARPTLLQGAAVVGADVEFISDLRHDGSEVALVQMWLPNSPAAAAGAAGAKRQRGGRGSRRGGPAAPPPLSRG